MEKWNQSSRAGKPSIAIGPWDAGHFGTDSWDPKAYSIRIDQLTGLGVTHVPIMLSGLGRDSGATRAAFLERMESFAEFAGLQS